MLQNGQDPDVLQADAPIRKLSLPLASPVLSDERFSVTVSADQLAAADLGRLARDIYAAYRAQTQPPSGG